MLKFRYFFMALCLFLSACQNAAQPPAPLGERATLQQLADAYESLSQSLPVSPAGLTAEGKLKFVRAVFHKAGYDYSETLHALANTPRDTLNAYHKDMMELLFLPHQGLNRQDLKSLYSKREITSIEKIRVLLAQTTEDIPR